MASIEVKNISKIFDNKLVLKDLNFNVNDGELLSILGKSGCGKTTLLKILIGIEKPSSGIILKNNKNIDIVNCNVNVFDDRGIYGARKYSEYIEFKDFLLNNPIVHPSIMGRKSAFSKVGNYRDLPFTMRNEDYDLFLRMLNKGVTFYTLQDIVFNFRENTQSLKRRKYKYRINEYMVKFDNFKRMNILPKYYIFCLKPLIVGLIPGKILLKIRNKTRSENKK